MKGIFDRLILLLLPILCSLNILGKNFIFVLLAGICSAGLLYYNSQRKTSIVIFFCICLLIILNDSFMPLIMLLIYETIYSLLDHDFDRIKILLIALALYLTTSLNSDKFFFSQLIESWIPMLLFICLFLLSIYIAYLSHSDYSLEVLVKQLRDDNEEFKMNSIKENKLIIQHQNNEITVATLKERNRIAREIHDNVGHLLSRCILQMGALQTIYKEEPLAGSLGQINETLNESMTNIRNSVHDIHNEALDLRKAVNDILTKQNKFELFTDYDMSDEVPKEIKYCLLAILQEALNNAIKHSNGKTFTTIMHEHPAFYQIVIRDDGTSSKIHDTGIGLHNMQSRVAEVGGTLDFQTDEGFRIFIMIPRNSKEN